MPPVQFVGKKEKRQPDKRTGARNPSILGCGLIIPPMLSAQIAQKFSRIVISDSHRLGTPWVGTYGRLALPKEHRDDVSGVEGKKKGKGLLDGVPLALPALTQAQEYQDRAARVGFDWPEIEGVLDKIREEIEEIKQTQNLDEVTAELGDLFFVLVNLARWRKVDAESALRGANLKFKKRFAYVEKRANRDGRNLSDMTLDEMDASWNEAKKLGM